MVLHNIPSNSYYLKIIFHFFILVQAKSVTVGPWGGDGGDLWSYTAEGAISHINLTYSGAIYSIIFTSKDKDGKLHVSNKFGAHDGDHKQEIEIDTNMEVLNGISGTFGKFKDIVVVTSLSFSTTKRELIGPFGSTTGETFSLSLADGGNVFSGFHGRAGWWLNSIGPYLKNEERVVGGPWGGGAGDPWTYKVEGVISNIKITYELNAIYSIIFKSKDKNGNFHVSKRFGTHDGSMNVEIPIDTEMDALDGISGTYGTFKQKVVVTSLSFSTVKKGSIGPFGDPRGTAFSQPAIGGVFSEFIVRSGWWLDAIGAVVNHDKGLVTEPWGGSGGKPWSYKVQGAISNIVITHDEVLYSIIFTSKDGNGDLHVSPKLGTRNGSKKDEVNIDIEKETLNGISGTYGNYNGRVIVTSLSFSTTLRDKFGPYGSAVGTPFSLPIKDGVFDGFHGHSGWWVDSIGVHLKPTQGYFARAKDFILKLNKYVQ